MLSWVFFLGCAVAVAHYYAMGSAVELVGVVVVSLFLMKLLSSRRAH
jgi:hypothetical protein